MIESTATSRFSCKILVKHVNASYAREHGPRRQGKDQQMGIDPAATVTKAHKKVAKTRFPNADGHAVGRSFLRLGLLHLFGASEFTL